MDYIHGKEIENLDSDAPNFKINESVYYKEIFPGFDPYVYQILKESAKEESKVIDTRPPALEITHEEITLKIGW